MKAGNQQIITELAKIRTVLSRQDWIDLQALDAAKVIAFKSDENGLTVWVSHEWCTLAQISAEDAMGQGWTIAIHPDDRRRVLDEWDECVREHRPFRAHYRFLSRGGISTPVECTASLMPGGGYYGNCRAASLVEAVDRARSRHA